MIFNAVCCVFVVSVLATLGGLCWWCRVLSRRLEDLDVDWMLSRRLDDLDVDVESLEHRVNHMHEQFRSLTCPAAKERDAEMMATAKRLVAGWDAFLAADAAARNKETDGD